MIVLVVCLVVFDQFTKWLTVTYIAGKQAITVIDGVLEFVSLENTGALLWYA